MEYQKIINLIENAANQPTKFRAKNWSTEMMTHVEYITKTAKLNLKLQY